MGGSKSLRLTELTPPKNNNIFFRYFGVKLNFSALFSIDKCL